MCHSSFDELNEYILQVNGTPFDRRPTNVPIGEEVIKFGRGGTIMLSALLI